MTACRFKQVDVFTSRPFFGNPVAVVLDADGIDPAEMQRIAAWTNLAETTFVLRPSTSDADYRLRIFTPNRELPFAGHPTVGSAHAVLEAGVVTPKSGLLRQECGAGILALAVEGKGTEQRIFVRVPDAKFTRPGERTTEDLSAALGAPAATRFGPITIDVGAVWLVALMEDAETVRCLTPDMAALARISRELSLTGVTVFAPDRSTGAALRVRTFAPAAGIAEDPVCGSGNATVAAFLAETGLLDETGRAYIASQGTEVGRDGRVHVRVGEDGGIEVGGCAVTVIDGEIRL